ncbi:MAG: flagellar protein export ATPase FliI [Alphaproteobacteria bacterium]|nr:flagellar protein export ATPase FliI [Alphaproteobacteria bacterium]
MRLIDSIIHDIERLPEGRVSGRVTSVKGLLLECAGIEQVISIGSRCRVLAHGGREVVCEVVGFREQAALLMPFSDLEGVGLGCKVLAEGRESVVYPDESWLGRVVNAMGEPVDGGPPLAKGAFAIPYRNTPPPSHQRKRVRDKLDLGVRPLNTFLTCCRGQRMGIFSGSGVGKSTLMSMLAKYSKSDVNVIGLVGERGREVKEFIEDYLGEEGLARSVVVVATSDESALMRRQAAYLTMSIAEYFRDRTQDVLCLIDSLTRFAMSQREIGLSAGEPPTSKGYPPTVFAELPRLLERAGQGTKEQGSITGLFTVLVEGDDHNEPISDAVRGIVDGHIVLERAVAERGRFPAINILRSVSRTMPDCNTPQENVLITKARQLMATYNDMEDMIRLGAYRAGSDAAVDEAIHYHAALEEFLSQSKTENAHLEACYAQLAKILGIDDWKRFSRGEEELVKREPPPPQPPRARKK